MPHDLYSAPLKIILAEDDPDDHQYFLQYFKKAELNVHVQCLHNGALLLQYLNDKFAAIPDVFFLDLNMPYVNGKECLQHIRSQEKFDSIPVVMMSTSKSKKLIQEIYSEGANLYLDKQTFFEEEICFLQILFRKYQVTCHQH